MQASPKDWKNKRRIKFNVLDGILFLFFTRADFYHVSTGMKLYLLRKEE